MDKNKQKYFLRNGNTITVQLYDVRYRAICKFKLRLKTRYLAKEYDHNPYWNVEIIEPITHNTERNFSLSEGFIMETIIDDGQQ